MESKQSSSHLIAPDYENNEYSLPSEEEHEGLNRLQTRQYLLRFTWKKEYTAPIHEKLKAGAKVIDVACDMGYWLLDMASKYPKSQFTGVDKVSIPHPSDLSSNANFEMGDAYCLPYEDGSLDFVRFSFSLAIFPAKDWTKSILPEALRILKPGGYIELQEFDCDMNNLVIQFLKANKMDTKLCSNMEKYLRETNFVSIDTIDVECNIWDGTYGKLALEDFITTYKLMMPYLSKFIGIEKDPYLNLLKKLEEEVKDYKSSHKLFRFIGRKPS
ncbi:3043_t:CDS:2 [Funneliformis caledonium]|uniref:3043_t:CDS:1 n=1 Tax=Funneliformis caledonium TaxID=1117310 RepID=A0A9N9AX28_9GLOM|nr:3043_t:CDS:2 [Funneliformis caledonium]